MDNHNNPYAVRDPVSDRPAFVGREDVLRAAVGTLLHAQGNVVALYGQRCIGKTSIVRHLANWLPRGFPYFTAYLDWQDKAAWPVGRMFQELARVIAQGVGVSAPALQVDPGTLFCQTWLPDLLRDLPEGHALVLLLDGFDALETWEAEQAAADFWPALHGLLADNPERLKCVLVMGQAISDLTNLGLSGFKNISFQHVSLLGRKDILELARLSEKADSLTWSEEALERVWQLTRGHPFLTQQLCSHVWDQAYKMHPGGPPTVSWADVDAAAPAALDAGRDRLEWLWAGLPLAEQVLASMLAEAGSAPLSPEKLASLARESGAHVLVRDLPDLARLLQNWDWIEPVEGSYRFRVELLRRWVAEHKPLHHVRGELVRLDPVVENLYRAAWGLYRGGQLEQAAIPLRQALGRSPDHVGANQLLADLLLDQGQVDRAQQILTRLHAHQPAAARARLVAALLSAAQATQDADRQLTLYERILELEPAQPEATARVAELQQARRHRDLEARLQQLAGLEQAKQYHAALDLAQWLADEYPDWRDWAPDLERLQRKADLANLYRRALEALQKDDRASAQALLIQVIAVDPEYGEATLYLHLVVTDPEAARLRARREVEGQGREQAGPPADALNPPEEESNL